MALSSLKPGEIFGTVTSLLPNNLDVTNYIKVFAEHPLAIWMKNGFIVSLATAFFSIAIACFAAYSLSRYRFKGKALYSTMLLGTQMIPVVLLVIPIYVFFKDLNLLNSLLGLIIAYITFGVPLCTMLLKSFFDTVSVEIEESALIDGCSRLGTLLRIVLPLSLPGLAVTALFAFLQAWNEYVYAATFLSKVSKYTTSIGLHNFIGQHRLDWGGIMSASVIVTLPTFVVFAFLQKGLIRGLGTGALKG
jgi:ABC-type glycerol-3-phosphate transport system permease component